MEDYVIAIPSYKRPTILRDRTLKTLQKYKIPKEKIFIFVADSEEYQTYLSTLPSDAYQSLIITQKGLNHARNFINAYFPLGQYIVEADDDIKGFLEFDASCHRSEKPLTDLHQLICRGFQEALQHNARLWGLYPSANGYFMSDSVTSDFRHIVGSFWGQINPGPQIHITLESKEDYQRTILFYLMDNSVIRLNFASPQTAYYKTPGGLQETRSFDKIQKEVDYLVATYPNLVALNPRRKTGFPEIRLLKLNQKKSN